MIRKSVKRIRKSFLLKQKKQSLYVLKLELSKVFELFDVIELELSRNILMNIIIAGISIFVMAQISLSARPASVEYIDKLPSYVDLKRKFISSNIGRTFAACIGFARAFPYLIHEKRFKNGNITLNSIEIITDMINSIGSNINRCKASVFVWQVYALGEMNASLGQMLSCPSTNLKILNINESELVSYDLRQCIKNLGINKNLYLKFNINLGTIKLSIQKIYMLDSKNIPIKKLIYAEPININSKIQNEILGNSLIRNNLFNIEGLNYMDLVSVMYLIQRENYLSKHELIGYEFAINSGDKNVLRKYTHLIKKRLADK